MTYAPVIIFAFNRPDAFGRVVDDLRQCALSGETDLFVMIDGPRPGRENEAEVVSQVIRQAYEIEGFRSIEVRASAENHGLSASVINGVNDVVARFGRVIVVEDDLRLSPNFLVYMNCMLDAYNDDDRIFQISGFGLKVKPPHDYSADVYFNIRPASWGWATWSDRWHGVDWQVRDYDDLARNPFRRWRFNRAGSDMFSMLRAWHEGRNDSWAIRFAYSMHRQNRLCVCPILSLTRNEGFGADATHCIDGDHYVVNMCPASKTTFILPLEISVSPSLIRQSASYFSLRSRFLHGRKWRSIKELWHRVKASLSIC